MVCPECNGRGEAIYYVETDRDENSITLEQRKGICRTCNGSGEKHKTNADLIRAMSDQGLALCLYEIGYVGGWYSKKDALEWLQQPAEVNE